MTGKPDWIRRDKVQPESGTRVLGVGMDGRPYVCVAPLTDAITHWMPFPDLPELDTLVPCPFCRSTDLRVRAAYVECRECGATGPQVHDDVNDGDAAHVNEWNLGVPR